MSLRVLSKRIRNCSREMDQQRHDTQRLLKRQKDEICQRLQKIPLPAAIGLALVSGFLVQRIFRLPMPIPPHMIPLFIKWQSL